MLEGRVTRAVTGFFDVTDGTHTRLCRARGVFRKRGVNILVGDLVHYEAIGGQEGVITEVLPRRTELVRPPIANVDQVCLVFSLTSPEFHPGLLDRMLVNANAAGIEPLIVITKCDLGTPEALRAIREPYDRADYRVVPVSSHIGYGIADVHSAVLGRVTVFAGASGVGKSTLLNAIAPGLGLKMGEISEKLGRGKHTTRHVELFKVDEQTYIADAPGFSQLDLTVSSRDLRRFFPEFTGPAEACVYRGCLHLDEEDCGVKSALQQGQISDSRYLSYCGLLQELIEKEARQY